MAWTSYPTTSPPTSASILENYRVFLKRSSNRRHGAASTATASPAYTLKRALLREAHLRGDSVRYYRLILRSLLYTHIWTPRRGVHWCRLSWSPSSTWPVHEPPRGNSARRGAPDCWRGLSVPRVPAEPSPPLSPTAYFYFWDIYGSRRVPAKVQQPGVAADRPAEFAHQFVYVAIQDTTSPRDRRRWYVAITIVLWKLPRRTASTGP